MTNNRAELREEDVDSIGELLNIINGLRRDNDELRTIVIKNQFAQAAVFAKAFKAVKQLLVLIAVAGSGYIAFNTIPEDTKKELSSKYLDGLAALAISVVAGQQLLGKKDEVDETQSGYIGYTQLDQDRSMEGDRRKQTY
jgi:hypothetical protein